MAKTSGQERSRQDWPRPRHDARAWRRLPGRHRPASCTPRNLWPSPPIRQCPAWSKRSPPMHQTRSPRSPPPALRPRGMLSPRPAAPLPTTPSTNSSRRSSTWTPPCHRPFGEGIRGTELHTRLRVSSARRRTRREDRIRTAKSPGLSNLPLHRFDQNRIWIQLVQFAYELVAWTQMLARTGTRPDGGDRNGCGCSSSRAPTAPRAAE